MRLEFDPKVYRLAAVKKAAYRFGEQCFVEITAQDGGNICVTLAAKATSALTATIEGEFRNEVLDQELRESVYEETERVRNLLLAQAFSGVSLVDTVGENADHHADPLGISRSQAEEH